MVEFSKYNPNHDDKGRFASGSGMGGSMTGHVMASRLRKADGGFTFNPRDGKEPVTGFAVSIYPDRGKKIGDVRRITPERILSEAVSFREENTDVLNLPGNNIGAWHDPDTHIGHLDISAVVKSRDLAASLGREHKQIAYFDLNAGRSVDIDHG